MSRARHHGVDVALPDAPVTPDEVGAGVLGLVAGAQASGVDADQAVRAALRSLEEQIAGAESQ